MKKVCLLFFVVALFLSSYAQYVDLGLPSGTKWKSSNEAGFYTYEKAVNTFGDKLPTKKQCEELKDKCKWTWNGNGYKVTGPNGQSIVLPATSHRDCDGDVHDVGSYGYYWSSDSPDSEYAFILGSNLGEVGWSISYRCDGLPVRLVQK